MNKVTTAFLISLLVITGAAEAHKGLELLKPEQQKSSSTIPPHILELLKEKTQSEENQSKASCTTYMMNALEAFFSHFEPKNSAFSDRFHEKRSLK